MKELSQFVTQNIWVNKLIWSIILLVLLMLVMRLVNQALHNVITDTNRFYKVRKILYYIASAFYIICMLFVWLEVAGTFTTYIGLLSAGIAVALKDVFSNIVAWLFIMLRRPFTVGDRISINGQSGDVIDVRLFQFSLIQVSTSGKGEQSTGCIVDIPNHYVFIYPVINSVKGFQYIWNEIEIELTLESNWQKAKTLFETIVNKHTLHFTEEAEQEVRQAARKYMIYYNKFTPIIYTDVSRTGIVLTMRYLCAPKDKRQTRNDIWEDVLRLTEEHWDIDLAYPTSRVVNNYKMVNPNEEVKV
ncbi:mechanosensitive ion channel family protein [Aerococcaceae bacterium NML210727]|nr:mechanosensitive ion channel family protein [Aerococcaceae bacterium NML210727]MCW6653924.1 mechanosensitive ion channel family protein [Aerococcaceae bacterium NML201296]